MSKVKGLAYTKASNARFAKMTSAQKRVAIAKDVIAALEAKRIKPSHGTYVRALDKNGDLISQARWRDKGASFKDLLPKLPPCEVCAKGAIFVCAVARQNAVTVEQADLSMFGGYEMERMLPGIFTADQLNIIEEAFESGLFVYGKTPAERMVTIMRNIIANRGKFKPLKV